MDVQDALLTLAEAFRQQGAELELAGTSNDEEDHFEYVDLSVDRSKFPLSISTSFRGIAVLDASDSQANLDFRSNDDRPGRPVWTLKQNGFRDTGKMNRSAYLYHAAQPGKWMKLVLFRRGGYQSGQITSNTSGGVAINTGSAFTRARVTLAAGVPQQIFNTNLSRKLGQVFDLTGDTLFFGEANTITTAAGVATVGAPWIVGLPPFRWENTAGLWVVSPSGGDIVTFEHT
jgi:hypothetical protein